MSGCLLQTIEFIGGINYDWPKIIVLAVSLKLSHCGCNNHFEPCGLRWKKQQHFYWWFRSGDPRYIKPRYMFNWQASRFQMFNVLLDALWNRSTVPLLVGWVHLFSLSLDVLSQWFGYRVCRFKVSGEWFKLFGCNAVFQGGCVRLCAFSGLKLSPQLLAKLKKIQFRIP